jgi:hypothetical protein
MDKAMAEKVLAEFRRENTEAAVMQFGMDLLVTGSAVMPDGEVVSLFPAPGIVGETRTFDPFNAKMIDPDISWGTRDPKPDVSVAPNASVAMYLQPVYVWVCPDCHTENFTRPVQFDLSCSCGKTEAAPMSVNCRECGTPFHTEKETA